MKKITYLHAFNSMRNFLEKYYNRTKSDDIGSLLGDLQLFENGGTFDPAAWNDWMECIQEVLKEQ